MSFGSAAAAAAPRLAAAAPCPCGGGLFGTCCGPILAGDAAPSAERLMRSRYTAFAVGDARHLQATWHPTAAPRSIELDDDTVWERLEIVRAETDEGRPDRAVVEFRAHWRETSGRRGVLHETSRFRRVAGRWFYLDGDVRH